MTSKQIPQVPTSMEQQELQLNHYLRLLWRGKWLILLATLVALGGAVIFAKPQPKAAPGSYKASATVMIEQRTVLVEQGKEGSTEPKAPSSVSPPSTVDTDLNTQIELIKSRSVIERALAKLGPSQQNQTPDAATPSTTNEQVEALRKAITVQTIQKTNLLEIKAVGPTPELAEKRANAVVEAYMDYVKAERTRAVEEALEKVTERLQSSSQLLEQDTRAPRLSPYVDTELARLVRSAERSLQDFGRLQTQLTPTVLAPDADTGPLGKFALAGNQLNVAASVLKTASEEYHQLSGDVSKEIPPDTISRIRDQIDIGAAILYRASEDLKKLQASESDPLRYGELVVIEKRVSGVSEQAANISSQYPSGPANQEDLVALRQQLELLRLSPQETGIFLVDSAVVPQIAEGKSRLGISRLRLPLSAAAGMLLGSLAVLFKEQIDQTVRSQRRLRSQLGLATLGVVPKGRAMGNPHPPMVSASDPSPFSEALHLVGAALEGPLSNGANSFIVTSAAPKEGKTMLAVNLAQVLAQYGRRVLLVDGNLRKPDIAEVLYRSEGDGLSTALLQRQNPADYVLDAGTFWVLPGGKPVSNPTGLLSNRLFRAFLQQAQPQYDVILLDSPPAVGFAETKLLAKEVSGAILVVRSGATTIDAVKESKEELEAAGVPLIGAVLNFASSAESSHLRHKRYGPAHATRKGIWFWKVPNPRIAA